VWHETLSWDKVPTAFHHEKKTPTKEEEPPTCLPCWYGGNEASCLMRDKAMLRPATERQQAGQRLEKLWFCVSVTFGSGKRKMKIWHNGFWRAFRSVAFVRESELEHKKHDTNRSFWYQQQAAPDL
jgi:hypothetical protein